MMRAVPKKTSSGNWMEIFICSHWNSASPYLHQISYTGYSCTGEGIIPILRNLVWWSQETDFEDSDLVHFSSRVYLNPDYCGAAVLCCQCSTMVRFSRSQFYTGEICDSGISMKYFNVYTNPWNPVVAYRFSWILDSSSLYFLFLYSPLLSRVPVLQPDGLPCSTPLLPLPCLLQIAPEQSFSKIVLFTCHACPWHFAL